MKKQGYGSSEFFNKVTSILKGKYDTEIATLQADSVTLQHIKLQSLIMLELLEEIRKMNQKPMTLPVEPIKMSSMTTGTISSAPSNT